MSKMESVALLSGSTCVDAGRRDTSVRNSHKVSAHSQTYDRQLLASWSMHFFWPFTVQHRRLGPQSAAMFSEKSSDGNMPSVTLGKECTVCIHAMGGSVPEFLEHAPHFSPEKLLMQICPAVQQSFLPLAHVVTCPAQHVPSESIHLSAIMGE